MAVDVVHIAWSWEAGSQLDNRRIHVHTLGFSNPMHRSESPLLRAVDSRSISASGGHSVFESSLENEGLKRTATVSAGFSPSSTNRLHIVRMTGQVSAEMSLIL